MFPSWWRSLVKLVNRNGKQPRRSRRKTAKAKPSWRPFLEQFEERLVPTTISIPTTLAGAPAHNVQMPIDVDTLSSGGQSGLSSGSLVVFYDTSVFNTVSVGNVNRGSLDGNAATFNVTTSPAGQLLISFSGVTNTSTAGGSLALIDFSIKGGAPTAPSHIDLAADDTTGGNASITTNITDSTSTPYTLLTVPADNATSTNPYNYNGSDPDDGIVTVSNAAATSFSVTPTTPVTAGTAEVFTVTAVEQNGSTTATGYTGSVHITSTDVGASTILPADAALVNGVGSFTATLTTAGNQVITATDDGAYNADVTGNSGTIVVNAASATHLVVAAPASTGAGAALPFTVTAEDQFNNTATGYTGTVHVTSSDGHARLPASSTLSAGVASFSATLTTAGNQTLAAADAANSITGTTGTIAVSPSFATHFKVNTPSVAQAGTSFPVTVTALDQYSNIATGYAGMFAFSTSDASTAVSLPSDTTLSSGVGTFNATLQTAGTQTISTTDDSNVFLTGTSNNINVSTAATHFEIFAPSATAGTAMAFEVVALDSSNDQAVSYAGTVTFTSSDSTAALPANSTLSNGTGFFAATFTKAGTQNLTATDTQSTSVSGNTSILVNGATATHFVVSSPTIATAGTPINFTLVAEDRFNNTANLYTGTVTFSTGDHNASTKLPANSTLISGAGTFTATLTTAATQTLTATDTVNSTLTVATSGIVVSPAATSHFVVTAPGSTSAGTSINVTVTAEDVYNNTTPGYAGNVTFTSSDNNASTKLPANSTLTSGTGVFAATLTTAGNQTITATDLSNTLITGATGTIAVSAIGASHFVVTAPGSTTAGTFVLFTVKAEDVYNNTASSYAGTVTFSSTDKNASTKLPANSTLALGLGTFTATLTTAGNQTLTAADKTTGTISGTSSTIAVSPLAATHLVVNAQTPATAGISMNLTVTAEDVYNNTAPSYTGTVSFSSTDTSAPTTLPNSNPLTSGTGVFAATLTTAGNQTISATDITTTSITGPSNTILVNGATATHFVFNAPSNATAGAGTTYTIAAEDKYNNTANQYAGTVSFSSSDAGTLTKLQANTKLTSGLGTFQATLTTVGTQTLTANDVTTNNISGHTGGISVIAAGANHLVVSTPASATASVNFSLTLTAEDPFNNTAISYLGTVQFTTSDQNSLVQLPGTFTFLSANQGQAVFAGGVTLYTSNNQIITATDVNTTSVTGKSTISVSPSTVSHFTVAAIGSTTAGNSIPVTVTAKDNYNNVVPLYTGTVTLSGGGAGATFGAPSPLVSGLGTFSATLITAGNQTINANDTGGHSGFSNQVTVNAATATQLLVTSPANATAGAGFSFTVVAEDKFNNTAAGYTGTVTFTSTDTGASTVLPTKSPLTAGVGSFSATLTTAASSQLITAADQVLSTLSGATGAITVSAAAATHFAVSAPAAATAGTSFGFTVTAEDQFNNQATGYAGTVLFQSTDSQAFTPPHSTLSSGTGVFAATLVLVGNQTLTAVDAGNNGITGTNTTAITVSAAPASHFVVSAPAAATAGSFIEFTVTAEDPFNNTALSYAGTVTFTSSDVNASTTLPANSTLALGLGMFSATLTTSGSQTLSAMDTTTHSITGASNAITVSPLAATHFAVTAPASATAGSSFNITVAAEDQYNNTAPSYNGTVTFSSSDNAATLPANNTLSAGVGTFSGTMTTAGSQTLTATDATTNTIKGASGTISLKAAAATHYIVSAPTAATAGAASSFTVVAEDAFNNTATGYAGSVSFTSSDVGASTKLPGYSTLSSGVGTFSATLTTVGSQTLSAADKTTTSVTGASSAIGVVAAAASHFGISTPSTASANIGFSFTVQALDPYNNTATTYGGTVTFSSSNVGATLPANSTLTGGVGSFSATLTTLGSQTLTATDTATPSITGTSAAITVNAPPATHYVVTGGPATVSAGTNVVLTVTAEDQFNHTVTGFTGSVSFSSSDANAMATLPANAAITGGIGTFSATLVSSGGQIITATNQNLSSGSFNVTILADAAQTLFVNAPQYGVEGSAFTFTVTAQDQYGNTAKTYTGSVTFSTTDTAVGVAVPANSTLASGVGTFGATLISVGNQLLSATDTTHPTITGNATVDVPVTVSIPAANGARNGIVNVQISVNNLDDPASPLIQSGLSGGQFILYYDPTVFTVSSSDVQLGTISSKSGGDPNGTAAGDGYSPTVTNGWAAGTISSSPGYLAISLFNTGNGSGLINNTGGGTLVTVNFHVLSNAVLGPTTIDLGQDTGGISPNTYISDAVDLAQAQQPYNVFPAPDPADSITGSDPINGIITITGTNLAPIANNDSYSITERDVSSDPGLTVAGPGVLSNDTDPQGLPMTPSLVLGPTHGSLTFNSDGSFVYTPNTGYLGTDSFTYQDVDTSPLTSGIATVNLAVTARLSIPTNLTGTQGGTVVVPVNIDNPNPLGSGGLSAVSLAIDYNPSEFTFNSVNTGAITSGSNAVQTLTFGGTINNGSTFQLVYTTSGGNPTPETTTPITYSTTPSVLQANIQSALDALPSFTGNTLANATSATNVTITFQNGETDTSETMLTAIPNFTGTNPTLSIATTTVGYPQWNLATTVNQASGLLAITLVDEGAADTNPVSGLSSLALITFNIGQLTPLGTSPIYIAQTVTPTGILVATGLTTANANYSMPPRPSLTEPTTPTTNTPGASFVTGVDGSVTVTADARHFVITAASPATAGAPVVFTVAAEDTFNNTFTGYTGTVTFTSTDKNASTKLPANAKLTSGAGTFTATLTTFGNQMISATDTVTTSITGASNAISVSAVGASHLVVSTPGAATASVAFSMTVTAEDQYNNTASSYLGTVQFTSTDPNNLVQLPGTFTFLAANQGQAIFAGGVTLFTAPSETITATDINTITITGKSTVTVSPSSASHFSVTTVGSTTAGNNIAVTVTAKDNYNNVVPLYTGMVTLSGGGAGATFGAASTLASGLGTFSATLITAGNQTINANDTGGHSGPSNQVTVNAATATHFVVTAPSNATAGAAFSFTVVAEDQFNNTAAGYSGTVTFSSTDTGAFTLLPANSSLTAGVGLFSATLTTAGSQVITAADQTSGTLSGATGAITVSAAATTHFAVSAPTAATAGSSFNVIVMAEDPFNNQAQSYTGTVTFQSSDSRTTTPTPSTLSSGLGTFVASLVTVGSQTLTAVDSADNSITGTNTPAITVSAAPASHFAVSAPAAATAGMVTNFTVTAEDPFNNTAISYAGSVTFTSSDVNPSTKLPANSTLALGLSTFSATLTTSGSQTLSAMDITTNSITGASNTITVTALAATHFAVTAPASATAGSSFNVTVFAEDQYNNTAPTYSGTLTFTSSDSAAALPANNTLSAGVGTFSATMTTAGSQTVTATDTVTNTITGASTIGLKAAAATHYIVSAPTATTAGASFSFTVVAEDAFNNIATGYAGSVSFTNTDVGASTKLPGYSTLSSGVGTFNATLTTAGNQTLSATDQNTNTITGAYNTIGVVAAAASHFGFNTPSTASANIGVSFTVQALDPYNNAAPTYAGTVSFSSSNVGATLPANSTLTGGVGSFSATLTTLGSQTLTATDTATPSITGSSAAITVNAPPATHYVVTGSATTASAGAVLVLTVTAEDQFNHTATGFTGSVSFSSSDSAAILPAETTITGGVGTFSATLVTAGNQTITVTNPDPFSGSFNVTITPDAAQKLFVNAPQYGVAHTPFLFTVSAEDQYNNTATGYTGTVSFATTDVGAGVAVPANSALVSGVGTFSATLVTVGNQLLSATDTVHSGINGNATVDVPVTVSIPAATSGRGNTVNVKLNVNNLDDPASSLIQSGLSGGQFILYYDPTVFTVSSSDVQLGTITTSSAGDPQGTAAGDGYSPTVTNGWAAGTISSSPGYLAISLLNTGNGSGLVTNTGGGTLVTVNFHVLANAPLGASTIDLGQDTGGTLPVTYITDSVDVSQAQQPYNIFPAPDPADSFTGSDPINGIINITGINLSPVANNDNYSITERDFTSDPSLTVAGPGVLANDVDPQGLPLTTSLLTNPASGSLTFNSDGSFVYTPSVGFLGSDSFTYQATDGFHAATATVNLTVTSRLSIPTNLNGVQGNIVVVPVNIDNPNPLGSGGLSAASLAIDFNPNVLTFNSVQTGAITSGSNAVQTLTFGGTINNGSTFQLVYTTSGATPTPETTTPITYSTTPSVLQANIQSALDALPSFTGNTLANATSATNVTITFQNGETDTSETMLTAIPNFTGTNPTLSIATTTVGYPQWNLATTVNQASGLLAITLVDEGAADTNPVSGLSSLALISFTVNGNSPVGASPIYIVQDATPSGVTVPTALTAGNPGYSMPPRPSLSEPPTPTNNVPTGFIAGVDGYVDVTGAASHLVVTANSAVTAGNPFVVTVVAEDQFNDVVVTYNGTVHFTSSDPQTLSGISLPGDATLTNGVGVFAALLKTAGNQTITATDTSTPSLSGASNTVAVSANVATHFVVSPSLPFNPGVLSGPTSFVSTGLPFTVTVTAEDLFGNTAPSYAGTITFSSSDTSGNIVLPHSTTLAAGVGVFSATLATAGNQNISITGTTASVLVPGPVLGASTSFPVRNLVVTGLSTSDSGFTVSFNKPFNPSAVDLYTFGTPGTTAGLPDDVLLAKNGTILTVKGSLVFNAADTSFTFVTSDLILPSGGISPSTGLLAAGNYTITLRSFSALGGGSSGFEDAMGGLLDGSNSGTTGNFQATFSVAPPPVAVGLPDFARGPSNTDSIFFSPSVTNGSTFALSYTNPITNSTGTAAVTFSTNQATLQSNIQNALNGMTQIGSTTAGPNAVVVVINDVATGANVQVTFQYSLSTAASQLLTTTTSGITIGTAPINVANNQPSDGIPIALSNGTNVTSGSFTLQYNPSLLSITGAMSTLTTAGATFSIVSNTINNSTSATVVLSLSSPTSISATTTSITLGSLVATVPLSTTAVYGAKQLLHFSSEQLNGGAIPVTNVDAVQLVAYLGDVQDKGAFTINDASAMAAVAGLGGINTGQQTIPGFAAFPNLDPAIVGDVSIQGSVNITDAGIMNQETGGTARVTIPYAPNGLPINPVGPDPALSVPTDLVASPGQTVVVPVNIDTANPDGNTGMIDAVLALSYNPEVFSVSASDIQLGTVPDGGSGWQLKTEVNSQTGLIGVEIYSNTPIQTTAGGSLITVSMHVLSTAPAGATTALNIVPFVDPSGGIHVYQTQVSDAQGEFVLHPAITPAGTEPGEPGLVTIEGQAPTVAYFMSEAAPLSDPAIASTFDVQQPPVAASTGFNTNTLPLALLEQVFGNLELTTAALQESAFVQPGAILNSESMDQSNASRDLALLQVSATGTAQADWLSDDYLAYLGQTVRHGLKAPAAALLDGAALDTDDVAAGLDAYFAREAASAGRRGER